MHLNKCGRRDGTHYVTATIALSPSFPPPPPLPASLFLPSSLPFPLHLSLSPFSSHSVTPFSLSLSLFSFNLSLISPSSLSIWYRYNELMFTIETCQAASMIHKFYSPNIVASGSSRVGEDALSVSQINHV